MEVNEVDKRCEYLQSNYPQLEVLDLTGYGCVSAGGISTIMRMVHLAELNFSHRNFELATSDGHSLHLYNYHLHEFNLPRLRVLTFDQATTDFNDLTLSYITEITTLTRLDIPGSSVSDDGISLLASKLRNLSWLDIKQTKEVTTASMPYLATIPTLEHLEFSGNDSFEDVPSGHFMQIMASLRKLPRLRLFTDTLALAGPIKEFNTTQPPR